MGRAADCHAEMLRPSASRWIRSSQGLSIPARQRRSSYCLAAAVGSALGSLIPYWLGRAGGELFLLKRINEARLKRIRDRFEKQEFLALMIPATLPPPTPFKLFVFSAGVFEMKTLHFLFAVFLDPMIRFGVLSILTVVFGPEIVSMIKTLLRHHPSIAVALGVVILALGYLLFRLLRQPVVEVVHEIEEKEAEFLIGKPLLFLRSESMPGAAAFKFHRLLLFFVCRE
ncbi:MAG TPA: VTT domain-containing protein [Candidatus Angelobacter sp.]|jgi:membrane protein DedA with SNARE-associated domain|nr:VTT domain-containing protein [Candidatus Angelobacter sp.]